MPRDPDTILAEACQLILKDLLNNLALWDSPAPSDTPYKFQENAIEKPLPEPKTSGDSPV